MLQVPRRSPFAVASICAAVAAIAWWLGPIVLLMPDPPVNAVDELDRFAFGLEAAAVFAFACLYALILAVVGLVLGIVSHIRKETSPTLTIVAFWMNVVLATAVLFILRRNG